MSKIFAINATEMNVIGVAKSGSTPTVGEDAVIINSMEDLKEKFSNPQLATLYSTYAENSIKKFDTKEKGAERTWNILVEKSDEFQSLDEEASKSETKAPKQRDSKFLKLIEMFQKPGHYTLEEMAEQTGYTTASVIVRISVLRSPKYEYKLNIKKNKATATWSNVDITTTPAAIAN